MPQLAGQVAVDAVGQTFDPKLHEAVVEQHSDEVEQGIVISQHRCGYKMGEKLIRAATVIVSKGPENADVDAEAELTEEN